MASGETRASALNLLTGISSRGRLWLRFLFFAATILPLPRMTVLRLRLIHYARWTVLGRSLLFESNFNGTADAYVEAFSYVFPRGLHYIWGSSEGFPGPVPVESLRKWIGEGAVPTSHYYCAYPQASTKEILAGLEVRRRLREFNDRTRDMDAAGFAAEYQTLVSDLQSQIRKPAPSPSSRPSTTKPRSRPRSPSCRRASGAPSRGCPALISAAACVLPGPRLVFSATHDRDRRLPGADRRAHAGGGGRDLDPLRRLPRSG